MKASTIAAGQREIKAAQAVITVWHRFFAASDAVGGFMCSGEVCKLLGCSREALRLWCDERVRLGVCGLSPICRVRVFDPGHRAWRWYYGRQSVEAFAVLPVSQGGRGLVLDDGKWRQLPLSPGTSAMSPADRERVAAAYRVRWRAMVAAAGLEGGQK